MESPLFGRAPRACELNMRGFLLKLIRRRRLHRELEAELAFHREMSGENGNPIPLGNAAVIKEQAFDLWRFNFFENLWRDAVYAVRGLRRSPALVAAALVSLGLGIGVNTAMFSLGVAFLFGVPSVRDAGSVVSVRLGGNSHSPIAAVEFLRASGLFEEVAGENEEAYINFDDGRETHRTFGVYTSKNYFTTLGVPLLYGRGFIPSDTDQVAVLQYRFWRKYFDGDPSIVGRIVNLDGRLCTVVGILPENHRTLLGFGFSPDLFIPRYLPQTQFAIYARLKPGMSVAQARAGVNTVAGRMDQAMPGPYKYAENTRVSPVAGFARIGAEKEIFTIGTFFALLLAITGLVLFIGCINVASLLLARGSARRGEIAVPLALGAGRGRLLQQLLTESVLLSLAGAALGFALSQFTATLLARVHLPLPVPIQLIVQPDWRVVAYAALLSTFATLTCGLLPALQAVRESIAPDLHREQRGRLRRTLVTAQIAGSVVVLTTGFLFVRNLAGANTISPGFNVTDTLRADVSLPPDGYATQQRGRDFIDRTLRALSALPGVARVAAASILPFNDNSHNRVDIEFPDNGASVRVSYSWNAVTPDYFAAMSIPVLQGSTLPPSGGGEKVVVVNDTFVRSYLAGRQPVGTVFLSGEHLNIPLRIVGVVGGTKTVTIGEEQMAQLYEPLDGKDNKLRIEFVVRSSIAPALQLEAVRRELHRLEPMAGAEVETMYSSIGLAFLPSQVGAILLGSIGVLGLLLATVGLYGVMVYSVARRTREIGVRVAIGATRGDISQMVLRDSACLTFTGSAIGILAAFFVNRPLAVFLVPGLRPDDPLNFAVVLCVMIVTGTAAAWGPMRRAIAVDPNVALRNE